MSHHSVRRASTGVLDHGFGTSGGLSHQIEHHLFPSICHTNYVHIQDVVEKTCKEFGMPYQSEPNLFVAYGKMLRHLKIMGRIKAA